MKEPLARLNQKIQDARTAYYRELIATKKYNPLTLSSIINQLVQPVHPATSPTSRKDCELYIFLLTKHQIKHCAPTTPL